MKFWLQTCVSAISGVIQYGPSGAITSNQQNLVASNYPPPAQPVVARSDFVALYDLSQVPNIAVATPSNSLGPVTCNSGNANTCSWGCGGCTRGEVLSCPNKQHWAITFDDVFKL